MKRSIQKYLLIPVSLALLALVYSPAYAAGVCSIYLGQASLNELFKDNANQSNNANDFVEIKIINPALPFATFSQWTVRICERDGNGNRNDADGCSARINLGSFIDSTPPWLVLKDGTIGRFFNNITGYDAILLDENDDVVDYLSVNAYTLQQRAACTGTALAFPYQASAPGASVKFLLRSPDGTGSWGGPSSATALPTEGATNDGLFPPALNHYAISHSGSGVTCEAEPVIVTAHDTSHTPVAPSSTTTITLSTSVTNDGWALRNGGGTFTPPNQYTFSGSETSVEFWLTKRTAATIDIDVSDGAVTDLDGDAMEDAPVNFFNSGFRFYANNVYNNIGTQIAGKPSNLGPGNQTLTLRAVQTNTDTGACEAALTGSQVVDITLECINPNSCLTPIYLGATAPTSQINGTASVTLDFGNNTQAFSEFVINYPDSGEIQLQAQHNSLPGGIVLNGSSNPFVSRPFGFDVDVVGNPGTVDHTGTVFTTAGTPFQINIAAALWDGTDAGADGIPDNHDNNDPSDNDSLQNNTVTLAGTPYTGLPNFGREGEAVTLSAILINPFLSAYPDIDFPQVTLSSFSAGTAGTSAASFNDVGVIEIRAEITDGNYLGINTGAGETIRMISKSGYVGRFIPAFFQITPENGMFSNTCNGVVTPSTYVGQPFGYDVIRPGFVVSAMNALLPTPTVTQNYTGLWAKLSDSSVALTSPIEDSTTTGTDGATKMSLSYTQDTNLYNIIDNGNGTLSFEFGDDQFVYDKDANSEVSEFDSDIDLIVTAVTDLDLVSTTAAFTLTPDPVRLRFGRVRMSNVHGSELIDLKMPMIVEYFTAGFYSLHVDDDGCTKFDNADVIVVADNLSTPGASTISVDNPTAILGDIGITLTAPGSGITGQIDLSGRLNGGVNDNEWLRYSWDSLGFFDDDPFASATFGIFSGNDVNIYIQQIFVQP